MANWVRIAAVDECPPGECRELVAGERIVALCNVEGTFYAVEGFCPHQGGPLGKGRLSGCILTCPRHGLQIDVRTGAYAIADPQHHPTFPVRVEGSDVLIDLDAIAG